MDMAPKAQRAKDDHAEDEGGSPRACARPKRARSPSEPPAPAATAPLDGPAIARALLAWYDRNRRELPWRHAPGQKADPYKVWLSEIMLQQTTVKAVVPYFNAFIRRWPTVRKLAAASLDDVLAAWAGLGYYSRARNLHACANAVVRQHHGRFPMTEDKLLALPGIGSYTAAAIRAIGHGRPAVVVDGNVERVSARLAAIETVMPKAKTEIRLVAKAITPEMRSGDFAQAMMDLGATICTPRRPSCLMCPIDVHCRARAQGIEEALPRRLAKAERPVRYAMAFVALREDGAVLLRRRPQQGLLGGMMEVPSSPWLAEAPMTEKVLSAAPISASWWPVPGRVVHVFTHFRLELQVYRALVPLDATLDLWAEPERCTFVHRRDLHAQALPSVMRKIIAHALDGN